MTEVMHKTSATGKTSDLLNIDYASVEARVLAHYALGATPYGKMLIQNIQRQEKEDMEKKIIETSEGSKIVNAFKSLTDYVLADVAQAMAVPEHVLRGQPKRKSKIIKSFVRDGRRWELHATKGWRSYRA